MLRLKNYIIGGCVAIAIIIILSSFTIVSEGNRGLLFTFGSVSNKVIDPGIAFKIPFIQSIKEYTIRPILIEINIEVGPNGAITKDNQTIGGKISTFYAYKERDLVNMYSNYGTVKIEEILSNTVIESFKAVIGGYDIFSLPMDQDAIAKKVNDAVIRKIAPYPINLTELKIPNYDWHDDFDQQIKATMIRAQEVKQAQQGLLIKEQEAQKIVKQAEADKEAAIKQAEGEKQAAINRAEGEKQSAIARAEGEKESALLLAEAKRLQGEGIKKYNEAIRSNLDIELQFRKLEIEKIKAEGWNGANVPTNNYGPIPFQTGSIQGVQGVQVK